MESVSVFLILLVIVAIVLLSSGKEQSKDAPGRRAAAGRLERFIDRFETLEEVQEELRKQGLESCNLILAIDATKSNTWNGERTFHGRCLHAIAPLEERRPAFAPIPSQDSTRRGDDDDDDDDPTAPSSSSSSSSVRHRANATTAASSASVAPSAPPPDEDDNSRAPVMEPAWRNPYEKAIAAVARTLADFDDDGIIPAYVFGDVDTKSRSVKPLRPDGRDCRGLEEVLEVYRDQAPRWSLSGPTSFAAAVRQAISVVKESGNQFHVLVIIADGEVTDMETTASAIREASNYPLAIVVVGVGDGPWDKLRTLDDEIPDRRFDNVQAVILEDVESSATHFDSSFALAALMELPDQYRACRKLRLLG